MKAYFHYFLISYEDSIWTCFESTACLFFHGEYYNFWSMFDYNEVERGFFLNCNLI